MRDEIPVHRIYFMFSVLYALAIMGHPAIAPILVSLPITDFSVGIVFVQGIVLATSLFGLLVARGKIPSVTLYALIPYLLFRFAFLARMIENAYFAEIFFYIDTTLAFIIFFFYGLIPSLAIVKVAPHITQRNFSLAMNVLAVVFVFGLLLNSQTIFGGSEFRTTLESVNAISLTSAALTFIIYFGIFYKIGRRTKILAILATPILLAVVAVSKSRGPIVGTIAAFLIYFLITNQQHRRRILVAAVAVFGLGAAAQIFFKIDIISEITGRFFFSSAYDVDLDLSGNSRLAMWGYSWQQFLETPILGKYILETNTGGYPHNIVLEVLISMGVIGLGLFLYFLFSLLKHCFNLINADAVNLVTQLSIILFFKEIVQTLFSGNLISNPSLWIISCFIVSSSVAYTLHRQR